MWLAVFAVTGLADMAWTRYYVEVERRRPTAAAFWGAAIVGFGSFSMIQVVHDHWIVTATLSGGFVGTWLTVRFSKKAAP